MFLLTPRHRLVLDVLDKTGRLSLVHVERLLAAAGAGTDKAYARRLVSQLAHMQKLRPEGDGFVVLPHLANTPPDGSMLAATDVMLDVSDAKPLALAPGTPPCKLRFLAETERGIAGYAVIAAPPGRESEVNFALGETQNEKRAFILLIGNVAQREKFNIPAPHFFAMRENGKTRYFEGIRAT